MNRRFKWTMLPAVIGAVNTALIVFHTYHMDNDQLMAVNTIVSVLFMAFGVVMNNHEENTSV